MTVTDIIVLLMIALVVGGASFYIICTKRRGQRCIGCPYAKTCSESCSHCHAYSSKERNENK